MNIVILEGRLTKEPEVVMTTTRKYKALFTLAVDREIANANGEKEADFIQVVCWDKLAEFTKNWLTKGKLIQLEGRIATGSYDKDGKKVYYTQVNAFKINFAPTNEKTIQPVAEEKPKVNLEELLPF